MRGGKWLCVLVVAYAAACDKDNATSTTTSTSASPSGSGAPSAMVSASASASADPAAAAQNAADEEQAADELRTHHRHHHHGGVAMFIHMAIDTLGAPPEKKAQLDKIQSDLFAAMAPARDAHRALLTTLADGVAAGNVDKTKVDAAVAKVQTASAGVHAATIDALNALYKALSPEERSALMDKVKAHAAVWKKVNTDEDPASKEKGSHLAKLTETLSLTPDQADKISAALKQGAPPKPDSAALDTHLAALETAFTSPTFDAKTLATANAANGHIAKHGTARMVRFYETVTPLLTPEQRTKLADHLRKRLTDHHATPSTPATTP
jgi:Spy/CpxP family protein refolding chaperone